MNTKMKDVKDMESKKEYAAPQMQVITLEVQGVLLDGSDSGDIVLDN